MPKKFLKKHKHIDDFYKIQNNNFKGMSSWMVDWTTAKLIHENMDQIKFMRNYDLFNKEIADLFNELKTYKESFFHENYKDQVIKYSNSDKFLENIFEYSAKVSELQLFIREHVDKPEEIKQKSLDLFGINSINNSIGYNLEMYDKLQILLNYAESVKALFNNITLLTDIKKPAISFETETLIKEVIQSKGLDDFIISKVVKFYTSIADLEVNELVEKIKEENVILID